MLTKKFYLIAAIAAGLAGSVLPSRPAYASENSDEIDCSGKLCYIKQTALPLRVLAKPSSNLYDAPDPKAMVKSSNVRAFWPLLVFARKDVDFSNPAEPTGWYQVGSNSDRPTGWMQAKDVVEWRRALLMGFTHPGGKDDARRPVLFFDGREPLQALLNGPEPAKVAEAAYADLKSENKPAGVISVERWPFSDIDDKLFVIPVTDWDIVDDAFDEPVRVLQMQFAAPGQRAQQPGADTLANAEFRKEAVREGGVPGGRDLKIDIVFVVDMTGSMQPYIDQVLHALGNASLMLAEHSGEATGANVRFGLVGYRDDIRAIPNLEFTAKNFTPALVDVDAIQTILKGAKAASVTSEDWQEEVHAGYAMAVESAWTPGALRLMFLLGDASPHPVGHPRETTGLDGRELRRRATENNVLVSAIYLQSNEAKPDWPVGEAAFGVLAKNTENAPPQAVGVPVGPGHPNMVEQDTLQVAVRQIVAEMSTYIAKAREGKTELTAGAAPVGTGTVADRIVAQTREAIEFGFVDFLGDTSKPLRDFTAWAVDRDLTDPRKKSLSVRVMVNREDVDNLIRKLEELIHFLDDQEITQVDFFAGLQDLAARAQTGVKFERTTQLGKTSLVPRWLADLPYKSDIAAMSAATFEALSNDARHDLQNRLKSKLTYYRDTYTNVSAWRPLNDDDASARHVYPMPLDLLP